MFIHIVSCFYPDTAPCAPRYPSRHLRFLPPICGFLYKLRPYELLQQHGHLMGNVHFSINGKSDAITEWKLRRFSHTIMSMISNDLRLCSSARPSPLKKISWYTFQCGMVSRFHDHLHRFSIIISSILYPSPS